MSDTSVDQIISVRQVFGGQVLDLWPPSQAASFSRRDQRSAVKFRDAGFTTGRPCLHKLAILRHGSQHPSVPVDTGERESTRPLLRSMNASGCRTVPPAAITVSITSRELPPVVTTSSMTIAFCPGCISNPRRSVICPVAGSRSANRKGALRARATSWPMIRPPSAGAQNYVHVCPFDDGSQFIREFSTKLFGKGGISQHLRAL